jgi:GNAT superfamily N-acetyltransferase
LHLIRPFEPRDAEAAAAIWGAYDRLAPAGRDLVESYERRRLKSPGSLGWFVAETDGEVSGFADIRRREGDDGPARLRLYVRRDRWRLGAGTLLLQAAADWARTRGAAELRTDCHGGDDESYVWALLHGFDLERERTESLLKLTGWDGTRFARHLERITETGLFLAVLSLAETQPYLQALYDLDAATAPDLPGFVGTVHPYEYWLDNHQHNPLTRLFALALDGETAVAESVLALPRTPGGEAYTLYTCVRREYRNRGLALAVKVLSIAAARAAGATAMRTNNDPDNPAMLRVNEILGYKLVPGPRRMRMSL